jgi:hypothetical protein
MPNGKGRPVHKIFYLGIPEFVGLALIKKKSHVSRYASDPREEEEKSLGAITDVAVAS